jgi:outer membrane protein OmpA-like peptidoglycan-associated protein
MVKMKRVPARVLAILIAAQSVSCGVFSADPTGKATVGYDDSLEMTAAPERAGEGDAAGTALASPADLPEITFESAETQPDRKGERAVDAIAKALETTPQRVILAGFASTGAPEYARQLGELRAQTIKKLLRDSGIAVERMSTVGMGNFPESRDIVRVTLATPLKSGSAKP